MRRKIDLSERPTSRDELADWYSAVLDAQAGSGLSVAHYAEQVGVSAWTLYQWRRRLDDATKRDGADSNLVEVAIVQPMATSATAGSLVVRVGEGRHSIEVPRGFDSDDLCRLVVALESC
jgi:transposase-like protein